MNEETELLSLVQVGIDLVQGLNSIVVFGVGLWTWLCVFFVANVATGFLWWMIFGRKNKDEK